MLISDRFEDPDHLLQVNMAPRGHATFLYKNNETVPLLTA
jgi:hypothetical protein